MINEIEISRLKNLTPKQIATIGNIDIVLLVIADCDIKEYLKYRIMLISDEEELRELKEMYKNTEWWGEAIKSFRR